LIAPKAITSCAVNDSRRAAALVTIKTSHGTLGSQNIEGALNSWKNSRTVGLSLSVQRTAITRTATARSERDLDPVQATYR
jgi:hypothetical protein